MSDPEFWNKRRFDKKDCPHDPGKVGFGCPPKHARFQKGVSGNPGGRPKGSKNIKTLIYELGNEMVTLSTPNGKKQVPLREAAARKFWDTTLKGDHRHFKTMFAIEQEMEQILAEEIENNREETLHMLQAWLSDVCRTSKKKGRPKK